MQTACSEYTSQTTKKKLHFAFACALSAQEVVCKPILCPNTWPSYHILGAERSTTESPQQMTKSITGR